MFNRLIKCLGIVLALYSSSALAVNCQRAVSPVENTICNNDNLHWLDSTMTIIYRDMLINNNSNQIHEQFKAWQNSLNNCTSDSCIERAYYEGISILADTPSDFDWSGLWWNMSAPNMSGGTIQFSRSAEWAVKTNIHIWAGLNHEEYTAEARKLNNMALIERITDSSDCRILLIPRRNGALQVYSNADWGCRLLMPSGGFMDGRYLRSKEDPRPEMTLLSIGIFPDEAMDRRFRNMVGEEYQQFVNTANVYIYQEDLDNSGASVIGMWVHGAANSRNAILMYTANDIWAARISTDGRGKKQLHYFSTKGNDLTKMPRTLMNWRLRYLDQ